MVVTHQCGPTARQALRAVSSLASWLRDLPWAVLDPVSQAILCGSMGIRKASLRRHEGFWFLVFLSVPLMFHIKEHG